MNVNGVVITSSPRADAGGEQREVERARPGVRADRVLGLAVGGERFLERGDGAAEHELRASRARRARPRRSRT